MKKFEIEIEARVQVGATYRAISFFAPQSTQTFSPKNSTNPLILTTTLKQPFSFTNGCSKTHHLPWSRTLSRNRCSILVLLAPPAARHAVCHLSLSCLCGGTDADNFVWTVLWRKGEGEEWAASTRPSFIARSRQPSGIHSHGNHQTHPGPLPHLRIVERPSSVCICSPSNPCSLLWSHLPLLI